MFCPFHIHRKYKMLRNNSENTLKIFSAYISHGIYIYIYSMRKLSTLCSVLFPQMLQLMLFVFLVFFLYIPIYVRYYVEKYTISICLFLFLMSTYLYRIIGHLVVSFESIMIWHPVRLQLVHLQFGLSRTIETRIPEMLLQMVLCLNEYCQSCQHHIYTEGKRNHIMSSNG